MKWWLSSSRWASERRSENRSSRCCLRVSVVRVSKNPILLDGATLKRMAGDYGPHHLIYEEGRLYHRWGNGSRRPLIPLGEGLFAPDGAFYYRLEVKRNEKGDALAVIIRRITGTNHESPRNAD